MIHCVDCTTDLAQLVLKRARRAFFMEYSKPGKLLNGGGKCKSRRQDGCWP